MFKGLLRKLAVLNWGMIGALIVSLTFWAMAFAAAQDSATTTVQNIPYSQLADDLGITICYKGQAYSFISVGLNPVQVASTTAHELKHQEQASRFNFDCERFAAWYATPAGELASEAEAYATDLCVAVSMGADKLTLGHDYAQRIAHYLGGEANQLTAVQAMQRYDTCPGDSSNLTHEPAHTTVMPGWTK